MSNEPVRPKCRRCASDNLTKHGHYGASADHPGRQGQQKWKCKACGWQGEAVMPLETAGISRKRAERVRARIVERAEAGAVILVITAAQNATPVHGKFWSCILTMAEAIGAQIFVNI